MLGLAAGVALTLSALATATASAQEIIILTPDNDTYSGMITGATGGRFVPMYFDYTAGSPVDAGAEAGNPDQFFALARGRIRGGVAQLTGGNGFGVEAWGVEGLLDDATLRPRTSEGQSATGQLSCVPTATNRCWVWSQPGATVITPNSQRVLFKVRSDAQGVTIPFTAEVSGLATMPVEPGGRFTSRRPSATGTLVGKASGTSNYFSVKHRGEHRDLDATLVVTPVVLNPSQQNNIGVTYYRNGQVVAQKRGGEVFQAGDLGVDKGGNVGNALLIEHEYRAENPEELVIEVFNYNEGLTINYALLMKDSAIAR
jgi:hypothetical protein